MATQIPDEVEIQFSDHGAGRAFEAGIDLQELVDALRSPHFSQGADEGGDRRVHFLKLNGIPAKILTSMKDEAPARCVIVTVVPLDTNGRGEDALEGEHLEGNLRVAG